MAPREQLLSDPALMWISHAQFIWPVAPHWSSHQRPLWVPWPLPYLEHLSALCGLTATAMVVVCRLQAAICCRQRRQPQNRTSISMVWDESRFSGVEVTTLDNSTPVTRETLDYSASIFVIDAAGLLYASHTDGTY